MAVVAAVVGADQAATTGLPGRDNKVQVSTVAVNGSHLLLREARGALHNTGPTASESVS